MKLVTSVNVGGYEWSSFGVYRHPRVKGKYVVSKQGGCSCVSWEHLTQKQAETETPMTKDEVRKSFLKWWGKLSAYKISESSITKVGALEKLNSAL